MREEIVPFVVDNDEGRKVLDVDAPDGLHAELFVLDHFDLLDRFERENGGGTSDGAQIEPTVLLARFAHLPRSVAFGECYEASAPLHKRSGGIDPKLRIESGQTRGQVEVSWLVSWLERNGYDEAAGSLREGMEETLTVVKLALPESLRKSLATTNSIENLNGTIRRVSRNVKRWKSPSMIRRWTALGVVTAEKKFRRIKGYRHMGALVQALRSKQKSLDSDAFAA